MGNTLTIADYEKFMDLIKGISRLVVVPRGFAENQNEGSVINVECFVSFKDQIGGEYKYIERRIRKIVLKPVSFPDPKYENGRWSIIYFDKKIEG